MGLPKQASPKQVTPEQATPAQVTPKQAAPTEALPKRLPRLGRGAIPRLQFYALCCPCSVHFAVACAIVGPGFPALGLRVVA